MSPLRWRIKSTRVPAREIGQQGFAVGSTKVRELLKAAGYSQQSNRKTVEGKQHPDRNAQLKFIARRVNWHGRRREPSISVDTKKKDVLGNLKNPGRAYRRSRQQGEVDEVAWVMRATRPTEPQPRVSEVSRNNLPPVSFEGTPA